MKSIFLFVFLLIVFNSNSQTIDEFEKVLLEKYAQKETIHEGDWVYYKNESSIKETDLKIYSNKKFKTYLVKMFTIVCFGFEEINCVFTYDKENNEIEFLPEIWYSGLKEEFFCNLIGYELKNKKQVNNFIQNFKQLLKINNPDLDIQNVFYEEDRTIFLLVDIFPNKEEKSTRNIIVLNHPKEKLSSLNILNPANNNFYKIE